MDETDREGLDIQTRQQVELALRFAEDIQLNLDAILTHKEHVSVVVHGQDVAHLLSPPSRGVSEGLWTSLAGHEALLSGTSADQVHDDESRQTDALEVKGMEEEGLDQAASVNKRARTPVENEAQEAQKAPRLAENDEQPALMPDATADYLDAPNPKTVRELERGVVDRLPP
jgi:hypothetical protein